jgi:biotin carboxyl carrier protein
MAKKLSLAVGSALHDLEIVEREDGSFTMRIGEDEHQVSMRRVGHGALHRLIVDGETSEVWVTRGEAGLDVFVGPDSHSVRIHRASGAAGGPEVAEGELAIVSPMTGAVVEVLVSAGDTVQKGDPLVVVVAMKMNNEIKAPVDALVQAVNVSATDAVEQGDVLIVLEVVS